MPGQNEQEVVWKRRQLLAAKSDSYILSSTDRVIAS